MIAINPTTNPNKKNRSRWVWRTGWYCNWTIQSSDAIRTLIFHFGTFPDNPLDLLHKSFYCASDFTAILARLGFHNIPLAFANANDQPIPSPVSLVNFLFAGHPLSFCAPRTSPCWAYNIVQVQGFSLPSSLSWQIFCDGHPLTNGLVQSLSLLF
jgi:hypothetical protein